MTLEYLLPSRETHSDRFGGVYVDVLGLHHGDIRFSCYLRVGRHLTHTVII